MAENPRSMSFERFVVANNPDEKPSDDKEYIREIVKKSVKLQNDGHLKFTNFYIVTPFVAMGGDFEKLYRYYDHYHNMDPRHSFDNWDEIKAELEMAFRKYFS